MDDDGPLGMTVRQWAYYEQPLKSSSLGLQLMPADVERRDTKPFLSNGGGYLHRDCGVPDPPVHQFQYTREVWSFPNREQRINHVLPMNHSYHMLPDPPAADNIQILQAPEPPKEEKVPILMNGSVSRSDAPLKKRSQGRPCKAPKQPKKPKKVNAPTRDGTTNDIAPRGKNGRKNTGLVINGIDLDISGIPTPVCSCTGNPQQCYRWGVGGWQSACCTTNLSAYPLPMNVKRKGSRIAGRKMSQGAFKKVLEKLAGEGYNLSNPIDLKPFWAKHGTNKFVTIR